MFLYHVPISLCSKYRPLPLPHGYTYVFVLGFAKEDGPQNALNLLACERDANATGKLLKAACALDGVVALLHLFTVLQLDIVVNVNALLTRDGQWAVGLHWGNDQKRTSRKSDNGAITFPGQSDTALLFSPWSYSIPSFGMVRACNSHLQPLLILAARAVTALPRSLPQ